MHRTEATVGEEVTMQPRNTVADFNKLAAEAKGSTLLRITHEGQGVFVVVSPESGSDKQ